MGSKWDVLDGRRWGGRGEERILNKFLSQLESPGRRDQYGVIKAALVVRSRLLGTSFRPLLFHISGRFCPGCDGIADSLTRFLLAPVPEMLPVVGQLVEFPSEHL